MMCASSMAIIALNYLVFLLGLGSFIFHSIRTTWLWFGYQNSFLSSLKWPHLPVLSHLLNLLLDKGDRRFSRWIWSIIVSRLTGKLLFAVIVIFSSLSWASPLIRMNQAWESKILASLFLGLPENRDPMGPPIVEPSISQVSGHPIFSCIFNV